MFKTSEFISPMHPDKLCDRISDAILDECLEQDSNARCAIEVMGGHDQIYITGEMSTSAAVIPEKMAHKVLGKELSVKINIAQQSPEIAQGVDKDGAGDQGIMVGYACRDNDAMIPREHYYARELCRYLYELHPDDGKTQITVDENNLLRAAVASWRGVSTEQLHSEVLDWVSENHLKIADGTEILCNPAGDWEQGGFDADTGLTGRKIVADAYGSRVPVGGGAFSGKDWTKVDRSGAYKARQLAVELLLGNELFQEVTVQVAYAIGKPYPVQITAFLDDKKVDFTEDYREAFVPSVIAEDLQLHKPQFQSVCQWGHFGNDFVWDNVSPNPTA